MKGRGWPSRIDGAATQAKPASFRNDTPGFDIESCSVPDLIKPLDFPCPYMSWRFNEDRCAKADIIVYT